MNYITLRDIRKGHPFGVSSPTDADYVRIVKAVFDTPLHSFLCRAKRGKAETHGYQADPLFRGYGIRDRAVAQFLYRSISNCTASHSPSIM